MTDSDPIIAEIDASNATHYAGFVPVHLSDAPKVADLIKKAKRAEWILAEAETAGRTKRSVPPHPQLIKQVADDLAAAIRAIEPEWTP